MVNEEHDVTLDALEGQKGTHGKILAKTFKLTAHPIVCWCGFLFPSFLQFIERALKHMKGTNLVRFRFL